MRDRQLEALCANHWCCDSVVTVQCYDGSVAVQSRSRRHLLIHGAPREEAMGRVAVGVGLFTALAVPGRAFRNHVDLCLRRRHAVSRAA